MAAAENQATGERELTLCLNQFFSLPVDSDDRRDQEDLLFQQLETRFRQIASRLLRQERSGHLEQTTAIANLGFMKAIRDEQRSFESRDRFFNYVACVMRHQLTDMARKESANKRPPPNKRQ